MKQSNFLSAPPEWRKLYGVSAVLPPETERAMAVVLRDLEQQKGRGGKAAHDIKADA